MKDLTLNRPTEIIPRRTEPTREDDIDLRALLGVANDHKWFILIGTALFFLAGVFYVIVATPRYQASAMVQVERGTPNVPGQSQQAPLGLPEPPSQASTEIPLLTSRTLLSNAVKTLKLDIQSQPQRMPLIGEFIARRYTPERAGEVASPWFGLARYGWGGEQLQIDRLDVPESLQDQPLTLVAGESGRYTLLDDEGDVLLRGRTGVTASGGGATMEVKTLRANPGTRFEVTRLSPLAAITSLADNLEAAEQGRDSGIIAVTYQNPDPALAAQVLDHITAAYVRGNIQRNSAEAESSLKFVNEQLPKVRAELQRAQDALNAFQSKVRTVDIDQETRALLDQVVAINASLQALYTQQPEISRRYTPAHPAHKALQKQIAQLQREKGALQARMNQLPDIQQGLFQLTRDVEVTNRTYTTLLDQAQQLDIARASAIGNVRVIDRPTVDLASPVWPKKVPIVAGATALGAMLMVAFVFLRQLFNRGVQDPADVERLGLPVYASILLSQQERALALRHHRHRRDLRPQLLALNAPTDMAMEALRCLRTSLHFARIEPDNNLLMIAGPSSGVGKTFVCSNLAVAVAQAGQRVMLVDADMRRGTLHEVLGARAKDGLSELISRQIDLETAVRQVSGTENLSFISRGSPPPNPSELLMHPDFAKLLQKLAADYDLVIIDTPPVLAVTDAAVIGQHVGTTLLVVRSGLNQACEIALAKQRLEQSGIKVQGAIVNGMNPRSSYHYAYGDYELRPG